VVLRQEHRAGEKLFLDWAGATIPIHHCDGSVHPAPLFVCALGVPSYTYAEATTDQQMASWLKVQMNALEFYGGCPQLLIPDNTKTGVTRACLYEPDLNPTYQEFAAHYQIAVMPTRPRKPRDKAKAESAVQVVQRWIVMRLRHRQFFSVPEANEAIRELLRYLNHRPFRKRREESRASLFARIDRPALKPLPAERYDLRHWSQARVNLDYHVAFNFNWYSVPYSLTGQLVDVRATPATVEIFHRGKRVASHLRSRERYQSITQNEHRPKSHQAHLEWTPSRMVNWARADGSLRNFLLRLSKIDVLVIDDWAMTPLREIEARCFWEICEDRCQVRSLVLTSQMPVTKWHSQIGDSTVAEGILDRIVHRAHRIELRGESMRKNPPKQPER